VRAVCDPDNLRAEFAIQVASGWQGKGLGRLLLDKLKAYLRQRGTGEIVGQCLRENADMLSLARDAAFEVTPGPNGDTMILRLTLQK
jgi:acetyltransferase